jgi:anti-sigma factor RsiW
MDQEDDALTCSGTGMLMSIDADGALEPERRGKLTAHLADCAACRIDSEELQAVRRVLAARPDAAVPAGFQARLAERLASSVGWLGMIDWRVWTFRLVPVAMMLALIVSFLSQRSSETQTTQDLPRVVQSWAIGGEPQTMPVSTILLRSDVSRDWLLAAVLTAGPNATLGDYVTGGNYER